MTIQKRTNNAEYIHEADYLAATGRKAPLINLEKSDQPEHLCIFFFKAFLFAKKTMDRINLQLYKAKAESWFWFVQSLHMALCPLSRDTTCLYGQ